MHNRTNQSSATIATISILGFLICALAGRAAIADPTQIRLKLSVLGNGMVKSNPAGIICSANCASDFKEQTTVVLTATAEADGRFLGWQGACTGTQPTCSLQLRNAMGVRAVFSESLVGDTSSADTTVVDTDTEDTTVAVADPPIADAPAPAPTDGTDTNDKTPAPATDAVNVIQIGWPVMSVQ